MFCSAMPHPWSSSASAAHKSTETASQDHIAVKTWVYQETQGAFVSLLLAMELPAPGFLLPCEAEEEGSAAASNVHAQPCPDVLNLKLSLLVLCSGRPTLSGLSLEGGGMKSTLL